MSRHVPDPKTVKQVLCPGIWEDTENQLHFCATTWCEEHGYVANKENIEMAENVFAQVCREKYPSTPITQINNE